jgi:hypothetical protein
MVALAFAPLYRRSKNARAFDVSFLILAFDFSFLILGGPLAKFASDQSGETRTTLVIVNGSFSLSVPKHRVAGPRLYSR